MSMVGKRIRIISLADEPNPDLYVGKEGIVNQYEIDPWGDVRLSGTWGGIAIYPKYDKFEIINESEDKEIEH